MAILLDEKNGKHYSISVANGTLLLIESHIIPIIISASLSPNPAQVGVPVLVSVTAIETAAISTPEVFFSGEICSGEV